jgi:hypothetical protein
VANATQADADADVVGDPCDNCPSVSNADQANQDGDEYGDACEQPNCVTVINHWVVPAGDSDCDGYPDTVPGAPVTFRAGESFIGTVATLKCMATPGVNDEPLPDAWPPDFNDNQLVNVGDILAFNQVFGSSQAGGPPYTQRMDLNASGIINVSDVLQLNLFMFTRCS